VSLQLRPTAVTTAVETPGGSPRQVSDAITISGALEPRRLSSILLRPPYRESRRISRYLGPRSSDTGIATTATANTTATATATATATLSTPQYLPSVSVIEKSDPEDQDQDLDRTRADVGAQVPTNFQHLSRHVHSKEDEVATLNHN